MRRSEPLAGVAVEVFVEEKEIFPVRIVGEELRFARAAWPVHRAVTVVVAAEDVNHAIGQAAGQPAESQHLHLPIAARRGRGHRPGADAVAGTLVQHR